MTSSNSTPRAEAWRRGSSLAIEMLTEGNIDEMGLSDDCRDGRPQDNLLYRYLLRLRQEAGDDQQIEIAFCSVITEYIVTACDGAVHDIAGIERLAARFAWRGTNSACHARNAFDGTTTLGSTNR